MMRMLMSLGFYALIALGVAVWIGLMLLAWVTTSITAFVVWLTSDGLPVTIVCAIVAIVLVGAAWYSRRKVRA